MFNQLTATQKGMALALAGYTAFAFSDTSVKILSERGFSVFQIVTVDCAIGAALLLVFSKYLGGLKSLKDTANVKTHILRIFLNVAINVTIVFGLSIMPIALLYTGIFTKPFIAALIAIPLFGEKVGLHRWLCIVLGFLGVALAFQPWHADFDVFKLAVSLGAALIIAVMFLVSRYLQGSSILAIGLYPILGSAFLTLPLMMLYYTPMTLGDMPFFIASGILMSTGIICVSLAFRMAASAAVAPMLYSEMLWALLFGLLIFGDIPDALEITGAAIIIASGIYLIYRERQGSER